MHGLSDNRRVFSQASDVHRLPVTEGEPDLRDPVLTTEEKQEHLHDDLLPLSMPTTSIGHLDVNSTTRREQKLSWTELWPDSAASPGWSHSGIAILHDGTVVFAHPEGGRLVFLDEKSGNTRTVQTELTEMHSITPITEDGEELLWIADNGHKFIPAGDSYAGHLAPGRAVKVNLLGEIMQELKTPALKEYTREGWGPTSISVEPGKSSQDGRVWVADGYGASLVHCFDPSGEHLFSLDGTESGTRFDTPHGILVDTRNHDPEVFVADRTNQRIVVYSTAGHYRRSVTDARLTSPSSFALWGNRLLVTELHGAITVLDEEDRVSDLLQSEDEHVSRPGWPNLDLGNKVRRPDLLAGFLNSPHGIATSPTGDIYLTEWLIGGRQLKIGLL